MVANDWMAQDLADMLDVAVERPAMAETTALGAAMLAGVGCGLFPDLAAASAMRGAVKRFTPDYDSARRDTRLAGWDKAVRSVIASATAGGDGTAT
jgi:glycerol kinase